MARNNDVLACKLLGYYKKSIDTSSVYMQRSGRSVSANVTFRSESDSCWSDSIRRKQMHVENVSAKNKMGQRERAIVFLGKKTK